MFIFLNSCVKAWTFTSDISARHRKRKLENFKQDFWIFVFFKLKFTAILAGRFQDRGYSCSIRSFFVSLSLFWPFFTILYISAPDLLNFFLFWPYFWYFSTPIFLYSVLFSPIFLLLILHIILYSVNTIKPLIYPGTLFCFDWSQQYILFFDKYTLSFFFLQMLYK